MVDVVLFIMIKSASYSRLVDFEQCKYRAKLKFIDKIPEVKHEAADRGTAIHTLAEKYVMGKGKDTIPPELRKFENEFKVLRREYKTKNVSLEGEWGFDKEWLPCDYKTAWLRVKADAVVYTSTSHAVVIDYKTGRKFGHEIAHGEQVQLYAISALIRSPKLKEITVELWYLDLDDMTQRTTSRIEALRYVQTFNKRIIKMLETKDFPPNPNIFTCRWCSYGPSKGNQCEYGIVPGQQFNIQKYREKFE